MGRRPPPTQAPHAMSDIADDLSIRDVLARINRQRAETEKFVAEQRKLMAEA